MWWITILLRWRHLNNVFDASWSIAKYKNSGLSICKWSAQDRLRTVGKYLFISVLCLWTPFKRVTNLVSALLPFKTGAFRSGKPVQPVLVKYPNRLDTVTWTWDQPHGAATVALSTLSRPFTRLSIQILPVYHPSEGKAIFSNSKLLSTKQLIFCKIRFLGSPKYEGDLGQSSWLKVAWKRDHLD